MKICKDCGSKSIKIRKNYSHGRKSVSTISGKCNNCGSLGIVEEQRRFRGTKSRR